MLLVHMGGRIYDPILGRFLQADPFIQAPKNSQSYNRFAYVFNNPMSNTDPSGFISLKGVLGGLIGTKVLGALAKVPILNTAVQIGLAIGCGTAAAQCLAAYNGLQTFAVTGSLGAGLRSAAISYATGKLFQGIGEHFDKMSWQNELFNLNGLSKFGGNMLTSSQIAEQIFAHALVGGVSAHLQGGKFGHGFVSAGFTKGVGGAFLPSGDELSSGQIAQGAAVSAVIGGTVSKISGGKFANGAQTGAFQYLFNHAGKSLKKWSYENQQKKKLLRLGIDGSSGLRASETRAMNRLYAPKEAFVYAVHGNEQGIYLDGLTQMMDGPSSFADIVSALRTAGYGGEQPLFLLSCDLANSGMGQQLSNHFNQIVIGASDGHMQIIGSQTRGYSYAPKNANAYIKEFSPNG